MKACLLKEYGKIEVVEQEVPVHAQDEVLVKIEYASICGSDQHLFKGDFHPRTRLPFIPGHEFAGHVEKTGSKIEKFATGDHVAVDPIIWCGKCAACKQEHYPACTNLKLLGIDMDGGFSEYIAVKEDMLYKVPHHVPLSHAALVEVLSIGFHANNRAATRQGDTVAIFGGGKVGQSILQAVKTRTSGQIYLIDVLDERLKMAKKAFPEVITINTLKENPAEFIQQHSNGRGVDVAFEAVGHAQQIPGRNHPLRDAIKSIRGAGTVCVLGLGDEEVPLLMKELIWKEARIVASRVSHGEFAEAIEAMDQQKINPEHLITEVISPEQIQHAFEKLEEHPEDYLKILVKF